MVFMSLKRKSDEDIGFEEKNFQTEVDWMDMYNTF